MAFMLEIHWDIAGKLADFRANQQALCQVMLEHPGVIACHAEYPAEAVSEWTEIYATDAAFRAHLDNPKGKAPLGAVVAALREDHLPLLRRPRPGLPRHPRGLRHHLPRHRARGLRPRPARRPGLARLMAPV